MSQVILFDLDGTLTESGEGITKCVQYALEKMGITEENPEKLNCFVGPPLKEQFMSYGGFDEEQGEQAVAYYRERYTKEGIFENKLYPQIPELLEVLKINDKILGVASSKPEIFVKQILEYFNISQYFQVIVGSEMDGKRTDKAEVIEEALHRLHMENERDKVLMVGDKEHDVLGAKSCGIQCIGVSYGYGTREELEKAGAVYIAESVEDLGILASPNDEETTEYVESVRRPLKARKKNRIKKSVSKEEKLSVMTENVSRPKQKLPAALFIWRLIYPVLIHYGVAVFTVILFWGMITWQMDSSAIIENPLVIQEKFLDTTMLQLIVTSVISGVICFWIYWKDQKKREQGSLGSYVDFVWCPPVIWCSVIVLAVAGSQLLNDLIVLVHLNDLFPGYQEMVGTTMEGQSMWELFLAVGILAPIAEELVFRGLIFRRMRDEIKPVTAIVLSSLVFGLYHGNMVQFIYASLLGALLAIIYHRTGTLWTAVLAHMAANLWSLFGSVWWEQLQNILPFGVGVGIVIELLFCVIPAYWIFANKGNKMK